MSLFGIPFKSANWFCVGNLFIIDFVGEHVGRLVMNNFIVSYLFISYELNMEEQKRMLKIDLCPVSELWPGVTPTDRQFDITTFVLI